MINDLLEEITDDEEKELFLKNYLIEAGTDQSSSTILLVLDGTFSNEHWLSCRNQFLLAIQT